MKKQNTKPVITLKNEIYLDVFAALQQAEEIGGPEGQDYIDLMERIKSEVETRIANAKELFAAA
jgi:hypothetical protein